MSTIAFVLAAAAAGAAAALWRLDARQRAGQAPAPEVEATVEETELEPESEDVPEAPAPEDTEPPVTAPVAERQRPSLHLPGALRRERRAWAEEKGYDFARSDDWLNDEWSRGAASSGAVARDIVSGQAYGHEMVLMDLGGVNVMAMRRSCSSDVVLDARRSGLSQESSEDLLEAFTLGDFTVLATDIGVAERLLDERVTTAFDVLPEVVTAVWMEADWVLAQTAKGSHRADWEEMLAPLAMLADAACALPPKATAAQTLLLDDLDPTRQMPGPPQPGFGVLAIAREGVDGGDRPLVQRPEEPLDLPSRRQAVARGVVEPRNIGADEVEPIADGVDKRDGQSREPRMPRDLSGGSSLFDD